MFLVNMYSRLKICNINKIELEPLPESRVAQKSVQQTKNQKLQNTEIKIAYYLSKIKTNCIGCFF